MRKTMYPIKTVYILRQGLSLAGTLSPLPSDRPTSDHRGSPVRPRLVLSSRLPDAGSAGRDSCHLLKLNFIYRVQEDKQHVEATIISRCPKAGANFLRHNREA